MQPIRHTPRVVVATTMPSPYQVALFDRLSAEGLAEVVAVYAHRSTPSRKWEPPILSHSHRFLDKQSPEALVGLIDLADLVVVSGYGVRDFRQMMRAREQAGRPWVFWGERFGLRHPGRIGQFYRRIRLGTLYRSSAPMWGIGSLAVESYRSEFGIERDYYNVPYASDLRRFMDIERQPSALRPRRVLFSGSLIRRKGFDTLLSAFSRLWREGVSAHLWIVGDGPMRAAVEAAERTWPGRIRQFGFRQMGELPAIYAEADILCVPSRHDGWGLVVVEGLAAGMPVISTSGTGAAIDIIDQSCGWVVMSDQIDSLAFALRSAIASSPDLLDRMGRAGRSRAHTYDLPCGAARFAESVHSTLARFGTSANRMPRSELTVADAGNPERGPCARGDVD